MFQIGTLFLIVFKERLGNKKEIDMMFGTLSDGQRDDTKWRRVLIS